MRIADVKEHVLVRIGRELFTRGTIQGNINMQVAYPLPPRTTVRPQ